MRSIDRRASRSLALLAAALLLTSCGGEPRNTVTAPILDDLARMEAVTTGNPAGAKRDPFSGIEAPLPPGICEQFQGFSIDPMGMCSNHWLEPVGPGRWQARGRKALFMDMTDDPRTTGLTMIDVVANFDADLTGPMSGKMRVQVGAWSPTGFVPEPGGGVWEGTWHGRFNDDGSMALEAVAHGRGGIVDGLKAHTEGRWVPGNPPQPIQLSGYVFDPKAR